MEENMSRYDIHLKETSQHVDLDFVLNMKQKKIISGVVWDEDLNSPRRAAGAIVKVYKAGEDYDKNPQDIKAIGVAITDSQGEFVIGPFESDEQIILKIYKFCTFSFDYETEDRREFLNL